MLSRVCETVPRVGLTRILIAIAATASVDRFAFRVCPGGYQPTVTLTEQWIGSATSHTCQVLKAPPFRPVQSS